MKNNTLALVAVATLLIATPVTLLLANEAFAQKRSFHETASQSCVNEEARCQDILGQLQGHDNAATTIGNQPTAGPTPTPIPGQCPEGTIFDVTLQEPVFILPVGTVLCLKSSGINEGITVIAPSGNTLTATLTIVPAVNGQCPAGTAAAAFTSGRLPAPLSGTIVCIPI